MKNILLKTIVWRLRRINSQIGFPGLAGLGLLTFCTIFFFITLVPASKEVLSLQNETDSVRPHARHAAELNSQQPAGQLDAFYKTFPAMKGAPDALERLYQAATAQGVTLEQGEYNYVRNESDKLVRYEMTLPVKGDYLHIRKFLSQLLITVPLLSLDSVDFQRQKISDTIIEAQIKMTLYLIKD